ncbi:RNA-guided endonuclease InsQ/TnpB family protein [Virgibacillus doumboii]|uniref:RNA-guided endonuclease InsQ/TnpB family protein n=1 Tax=Virgibacillus doumboii TaxID=2697503 RepID=UPI0013E013AF|nr:RNA-guided endonuclease TnpB family protein [Virgibacillus doumboii]
MILNYKYEIYPTERQIQLLDSWISICRQQYNSALFDKQHYYKKHKKGLSRYNLQKQQTKDKKKFAILKSIPSQPLQEVFFRLEKAFDKFFKGDAKYPKQKKYKDYNSITFTQFGIGMQKVKNKKTGKIGMRPVRYAASFDDNGNLRLSKLGSLKINLHRKLDRTVKQVVIKRQGSRWFAIFSVEKHVNQTATGSEYSTTGIDVGIKKFAVLSDGTEIKNPKFLRKEEKKLKRMQRKLSRKEKGSENWKKQLEKVQQIHTKVANQRRDFHHKQSFRISNDHSMVFVEDLTIKNMVKNRHLAKSIHDAGWGNFRNMIAYKCERNGGVLVKVKPHYTSQNCSGCGKKVKKSLSIRTHICKDCGTILDRDHNAALNIEKAGLDQMDLSPTA